MWKFLLINNGMEETNEALRASQDSLYWKSNDREDEFSEELYIPEEGAAEVSGVIPRGRFFRLRELLLKSHRKVEELNFSSSSFISGLGRKGEKLLEANRKHPAPTERELYERKERSARGPSFRSVFHSRRIEACLEAKFILAKLRSTRG